MPNGDEFEIPGTVSLGFVLKLEKDYANIEDKDEKEQLKLLQKMVMSILKLDEENADKVNTKYIIDNKLDSPFIFRKIVEGFSNHVVKMAQDENLNSPQSK